MRFSFVGNLITHARLQNKASSILQLCMKFANKAK